MSSKELKAYRPAVWLVVFLNGFVCDFLELSCNFQILPSTMNPVTIDLALPLAIMGHSK